MNGHPSRRRRLCDQVSLRSRLRVEWLEDRTAPSVTIKPGNVVEFTEDVPGTSDALILRQGAGGLLEYSLNGSPFSTDLVSADPDVDSLTVAVISRIDVLLGAGNDTLTLDFSGGQVIPAPSGVNFVGDLGSDRIVAARDTGMTLSNGSLVFAGSGGTVTLSSVEEAQLTGGNSPNFINAAAFTGTTTIHGGNQTDTVLGGSGDDFLSGDEGSDQLFGNAGNDTLDSTNSGNSSMVGGAGNDTLLGGNGKDTMEGGDGDDVLVGGNGSDTMLGEGGDDILEGQGGNDVVDGGAGFDEVVATGAVNFTLTNTVLTGLGTDTLTSIEQARLTGGTNNTTIDGSAFIGTLIMSGGGGGNDTLIGGSAATNTFELFPSGTVSLIDSGGYSSLSFGSSTTGITIDMRQSGGSFQNVDGSGYLVGLNGQFENAFGSSSGDNIIGNDLTNLIDGGDGNDIIAGGSAFASGAADTFVGGDGSDTVTGDGGDDVIVGGTGFGISGSPDDDSSADSLNGGTGNDTIFGGGGNDVIVGGSAFGTTPGATTT